MEVENEVTVGVQISLLITDEQSVPIDTFNPDNLCLDAIQSMNLIIERQSQSSAEYGCRYSSATDDMNEPVTKVFLLTKITKLQTLMCIVQGKRDLLPQSRECCFS